MSESEIEGTTYFRLGLEALPGESESLEVFGGERHLAWGGGDGVDMVL